jgi:hypothetical protein
MKLKYYKNIPIIVRRRLSPNDFKVLNEIINRYYQGSTHIFNTDDFDTYFLKVMSDSLDEFVYRNMMVDIGDWKLNRKILRLAMNHILPLLVKLHYDNLKTYYQKNKM